MSEEEWRPVVGYEGLYEVSNLGRVYSHRYGGVIKGCGKTHPHVTLVDREGKRVNGNVHRLVMAAFVGPCPQGLEVRHLDDNGWNNVLTNLAYGTKSENGHDMVRNGRHRNARKTHCKDGHPYDEVNTYVTPGSGIRVCRTCKRQYMAERHSRTRRERADA